MTTARLLFTLVLVAALFLTACGDNRPTSTTVDPIASAAASAAVDDVAAAVVAAKRVRIGVKADTPPFGSKAGATYLGFDIDIAQAVAKQLETILKVPGLEVEFVTVTSRDRDDKLLAGEIDMVVASMTITRFRDREQHLDFTIPYFQDGQSLLVTKESPIATYLDLAGRPVGFVRGSTSGYYLAQVAPDCKATKYEDFSALFAALDAGEIEAATSDQLILMGRLRAAKNPDAYRIAGERFTTEPYGIAVRENQSAWRDALNEAIQQLWENGRWAIIADTWFGPTSTYPTTLGFAITPYPK
ncbi:MAG: transporter substrate-binding domain-containing protein [Planctomycetes bacterium]|nr:transporter substrate-binding domain-containing protein [Planctomycetota bacterium]